MNTEAERLQAIRARWQAATPGPWFVAPDGVADGVFATDGTLTASSETLRDAIAIAAAPTDIATLLAALDAAEARAAIVQRIAERALARDTVIPLGAAGRDKAFRLLEEFCGDMQYLANRVAYVAPAQETTNEE